jgi:excinuclease UvrABC nuclease subunit
MTSFAEHIARHLGITTTDRPTAVYRFYDVDDRLLYVGITYSLGARFRGHERLSPWWPKQRSVKIVWRDTRDEAATEERKAIREEAPLHNVAGTRVPRTRVRAQRLDPALREAIAREVRGEIARAGKSKREVREALALSTQSLWARYVGQIDFQEGELEALAEFLGIPVATFFPASAGVA